MPPITVKCNSTPIELRCVWWPLYIGSLNRPSYIPLPPNMIWWCSSHWLLLMRHPLCIEFFVVVHTNSYHDPPCLRRPKNPLGIHLFYSDHRHLILHSMSFLVRLLNFQRWVNTLLSLTLGRLKCVDSVRHEGPKVSTSSKGSCLSRTPPIWVDEIQEYMTHVYSLWNGSRYNMLCTLFILKKKKITI